MRSKSILTLLAAGAMSLGIVTAASAGSATGDSVAPVVAFGPAGHGELHNDGGKPDTPGDPGDGSGDHGKPEVTGKSADAGLHGLPDQASERAHAVVAAAFKRHEAIRSQLDGIRALPPGQRGKAVSALMGEFGELFRLAGDAAGDEGDDDA